MNPVNYIRLEIPNKAENVGTIRVAVASFASQIGFTVPEIEEIKVAVSEAVSNSVIHAYEGEGTIEITTTIYSPALLEVVVRDYGRGIEDVEKAKEATFTTTKDRMGLGMTFMSSFMDELIVESSASNGTCVTMRKVPQEAGD